MQTVLVTGVTGKQGGAVARHLTGKGFRLRGLTRKPDSDAARALSDLEDVEIVRGDLDDADSLRRALQGAWGVFAVQNTWEAGVEREEEQGKRLAQVAKEAGVRHFVYSSVGSAHRRTGIPHFDNKWRVEETVRALGFPSHVILRPVFFMENLVTPWFLQGDEIVTALAPDTRLQMVAVDDVGRAGAAAFTDPSLRGREIDLAGDAATMPEATAILGRAFGRNLRFRRIPLDVVRQGSEDFAAMLAWFDAVGYDADIPALERRFGRLTKLGEWAARLGPARPAPLEAGAPASP